jgi:acyl-CoA thioesterase-1
MHNCDPHLVPIKSFFAIVGIRLEMFFHSAFAKPLKLTVGLAILLAIASCGGGDSNSGGGDSNSGGSEQAMISPPVPDQPVIRSFVAIGDSIGNGAGFVSVPWPELVQGAFGVPLANDSINGRQTGQGLNLIRDLLTRHNPSHVLILLGTNDAVKGGTVSGAIGNLQEMANIAESLGVIAVIGTTITTTRSAEFDRKTADIAAGIRSITNALIAESRVAFGNGNNFLADDVHPNAQGQRVIADEFISVLR